MNRKPIYETGRFLLISAYQYFALMYMKPIFACAKLLINILLSNGMRKVKLADTQKNLLGSQEYQLERKLFSYLEVFYSKVRQVYNGYYFALDSLN